MESVWVKKLPWVIFAAVGCWFGVRYLLPILLPFGIGTLVAMGAEPAVRFGMRRLRLKRGLSAIFAVSLTLLLTAGLMTLIGAFAIRELGHLAKAIPDMEAGTQKLQQQLQSFADRSPEGIRPLAQRTVQVVFDDGNSLIRQLSQQLPGVLSSLLSGVGSSLLGVGTAILSSFLISLRLPRLRQLLKELSEKTGVSKYIPALKQLRASLWGWLKAQGKLALVTWGIVTLGFWILGVPYAPAWAILVALVDSIPILGTGTVLIPWALVHFFQGNTLDGMILLVIYAVAALTRTVLEPRLVGKHLDLDPLATLGALYAGFRLWGIPGLLLTPILASAAKSLLTRNT